MNLGHLFPVLAKLKAKKLFLVFIWNFLRFDLCPLPLVLSPSTIWKSLAPFT